MTQIIIVSHSKEIADGTKALVNQMVGENINITAQGGVHGEIGTSYDDMHTIVNQVDCVDICVYEIGWSERNTGLAIEMYEGEHRLEKIDAPSVEGTFTAAVNLSVGKTIDEGLDELKTKFG